MDTKKMGQFIAELRKSRQMTQKDLAAKLNVSDKAVSKWERGLSCPDISLLTPLSEIFGVTTTELLNSECAGSETFNMDEVVVNALEYGEKFAKRKIELDKSILAAAFSILLLTGVFVVSVVNVAVSGELTWSLIPIASCVFAWLVFFPVIRFGARGVIGSLGAASVLIVPYLFVLDLVVDGLLGYNALLFDIGVRIAPLAAVFLWIAYFLFKKFKTRRLLLIAILTLLTSPLNYLTNAMVANVLNTQYNGIEVILNTFYPLIAAAILFIVESVILKRTRE